MPDPRNIDTGFPRPDEGARVLPWANTTSDKLNRSNISLGTDELPSDPVSFDWSIVDDSGTAKIKIGAGWVEHHEPDGSTQYYSVAEQSDIALSTNYNVIYVNYTIKSSAATSTTVSNSTSESGALNGVDDTTTILRIPLGCWRQYTETVHGNSKTVIKLIRKYRVGNVQIFPMFAA